MLYSFKRHPRFDCIAVSLNNECYLSLISELSISNRVQSIPISYRIVQSLSQSIPSTNSILQKKPAIILLPDITFVNRLCAACNFSNLRNWQPSLPKWLKPPPTKQPASYPPQIRTMINTLQMTDIASGPILVVVHVFVAITFVPVFIVAACALEYDGLVGMVLVGCYGLNVEVGLPGRWRVEVKNRSGVRTWDFTGEDGEDGWRGGSYKWDELSIPNAITLSQSGSYKSSHSSTTCGQPYKLRLSVRTRRHIVHRISTFKVS